MADVLAGHISAADLNGVLDDAARFGIPPQQVLLKRGFMSPGQYAQVLAHYFGVGHPGSEPAWQQPVFINATAEAPEAVGKAIAEARAHGRVVQLFAGAGDRSFEPDDRLAAAYVSEAVDALRGSSPEASAGRRMWVWQYLVVSLIVGAAIGLALASPNFAGIAVLVFSATTFAIIALFRVLLLVAAIIPSRRPLYTRRQRRGLSDRRLPTYAVLVPLFREAAILPDLVDALADLDYPPAKLDILLILEESDAETRAVAAGLALPVHMRTVVVPDRKPRTKPKALNMALALTRAEMIAVFDAEDIPSRDQLRIAAAAFADRKELYACYQARLGIYNPRQSWLSRQFTVEYATLFHAFLPALAQVGVPIPLSGTSNHFPRQWLEHSAWDPFNVTEDADLGMRLTRRGGRIGLLDTDTYEEAPATFGTWLPQRTRWIKGWMQTYLVHTRQPLRLLRELGLWRTLTFHVLFGGFLLSVMAYPWLFVLLGMELARPEPFAMAEASTVYRAFLIAAFIDLAVGIGAALLITLIGLTRAGLLALSPNIVAAPVYWLAISLAGYRALIQLIFRPHIWEKTTHTARHRSLRRPSRAEQNRVKLTAR